MTHPTDPASAMREAIERVLIGGNHLATYSAKWPEWQLNGLTRAQQCEHALIWLGATMDYDAWCCWSTIMQERDTLLGSLPLPTAQPDKRRSEEEIRAEIKAAESMIPSWYPNELSRDRARTLISRVAALRWVLNEQETGR